VKIPMMPKGVEHWSVAELIAFLFRVKIPMMPKGVEHTMLRARLLRRSIGEDSNDAERR
jgi:hypothetical protein